MCVDMKKFLACLQLIYYPAKKKQNLIEIFD